MTPKELTSAGQKLFGKQWRAALARALGIDPSTLRRWVNEGMPVPRTVALAVRFAVAAKDGDTDAMAALLVEMGAAS